MEYFGPLAKIYQDVRLQLTSQHPDVFTMEDMEKLDVYVTPEGFHNGMTAHEKYGIKPVLCHGDLWANNVYYERESSGNRSMMEAFTITDYVHGSLKRR